MVAQMNAPKTKFSFPRQLSPRARPQSQPAPSKEILYLLHERNLHSDNTRNENPSTLTHTKEWNHSQEPRTKIKNHLNHRSVHLTKTCGALKSLRWQKNRQRKKPHPLKSSKHRLHLQLRKRQRKNQRTNLVILSLF